MEVESIVGFEFSGENTHYSFPTFFYSSNDKKFYFKSFSLELGSMNFIIGERKTGKSLFLKSLVGLECPKEKPLDRSFLKYDIVYKPEYVKPKFNGTLSELIKSRDLNNNLFMQNINTLGLNKFLETNIQNFNEEQNQLLSFILMLSTEGLIYVFDCPSHLISNEKRKLMINILKNYCEKNDKIGIITENNINFIDEVFDESIDTKYFLKNFGENEIFGSI